jgi:RimJ/RimL family protein N-acetyltransferase
MQALALRREKWLDATEVLTDRLVLRAISPADATALGHALWTNRHHLLPWIDVPRGRPTPHALRRWTRELAHAFAAGTELLYTLRLPASGALLGCIGLTPAATTWELSYWLAATHTRQGYVREAVAALARVAVTSRGRRASRVAIDRHTLPRRRATPAATCLSAGECHSCESRSAAT